MCILRGKRRLLGIQYDPDYISTCAIDENLIRCILVITGKEKKVQEI